MDASLPIAAIEAASDNPAFIAAVERLYAEVDAEIAARAPRCDNRGVCCKFDTFGHNLFVTTAELAYFRATTEAPVLAPPDRATCPYQQAGKCTARTGRPAGCRIFFCDPAAQDWQPDLTERTLERLARIGEQFDLPYAYVEWTDALRAMAAGDPENRNPPQAKRPI